MSDEDDFAWDYSYTSTQAEQQTPFAEFAWSVQQLCKELWPTSFQEVSIERLRGGSFNRVIGLTVTSSPATESASLLPPTYSQVNDSEPPSSKTTSCEPTPTTLNQGRTSQYILRITRDSHYRIDGDIATLCYVRSRSSIPVPQIVAFDLGTNNPFGSPYSLQHRIPGVPLISILDDLTQPQCRELAVQLGQILRELQELKSSVPGELGFPWKGMRRHELADRDDGKTENYFNPDTLREKLAMMSFDEHSSDISGSSTPTSESYAESIEDSSGPKFLHYTKISDRDRYNGTVNRFKMGIGEGVLGCIQLQLMRSMMDELLRRHASTFTNKYYTRLLEVVREMDDFGYFDDDTFILFHHDLEARNIMVQIDDAGTLRITGILDWDRAKFVPRYVSCFPPRWLWCREDDDTFDECNGHEIPEDPDMRELKELFDQHVGEDFVKLAYPRQYCLARRLFRLSLESLCANWEFDWVKDLVKDWTEFRDGLKGADLESEAGDEDAAIAAVPLEKDSGYGNSDSSKSMPQGSGSGRRMSW